MTSARLSWNTESAGRIISKRSFTTERPSRSITPYFRSRFTIATPPTNVPTASYWSGTAMTPSVLTNPQSVPCLAGAIPSLKSPTSSKRRGRSCPAWSTNPHLPPDFTATIAVVSGSTVSDMKRSSFLLRAAIIRSSSAGTVLSYVGETTTFPDASMNPQRFFITMGKSAVGVSAGAGPGRAETPRISSQRRARRRGEAGTSTSVTDLWKGWGCLLRPVDPQPDELLGRDRAVELTRPTHERRRHAVIAEPYEI